jgi:hypothetical protein
VYSHEGKGYGLRSYWRGIQFVNGYIRIQLNGLQYDKTAGLLSRKWEKVIDLGIFQDLGEYSENFLAAKRNGRWGYIKLKK